MMRTKIKKEINAALPTAIVIQEAAERIKDKRKKKETLQDKILGYLREMAEKIDPFETIAIIGATIVIKTGIDWTENVIANFKPYQVIYFLNPVLGAILQGIEVASDPGNQKTATLQKLFDSEPVQVMEWLISFTLAYLIVHNFGAIIQSGGNILSMAKGLIGMV
jgi:hypothetical protein